MAEDSFFLLFIQPLQVLEGLYLFVFIHNFANDNYQICPSVKQSHPFAEGRFYSQITEGTIHIRDLHAMRDKDLL